jgi:hypothetical protein
MSAATKPATQPRVTLNRVNAELKALGIDAELVRGNGYFYYWGDDVYNLSYSVYTCQLGGWTLQQWIDELLPNLRADHPHKVRNTSPWAENN